MKLSLLAMLLTVSSATFATTDPDTLTTDIVTMENDTVVPDTLGYRVDELDAEYLQQLENLLEEKEKEEKIKGVIHGYEETLLKKEMSFDWFSTLPLVRGLVLSSSTNRFQSRGALFEHHDSPLWEYAPGVAPLALTWGLKAAGVESRSKTNRMVVAHAIGLGLSTGFTQLIKHTADETRPDGTDTHSMPSGHSSLAFLCAAILDREYGHHSPWITVGGYSMALLTQYRRIHHNHHYLNDVITGAGIGTLSANLGYFIADKIYGRAGINNPRLTMKDIVRLQKYLNRPTSLSFYSGVMTGYNRLEPEVYDVLESGLTCQLRTTAGYATTMEYDHYLCPNFAIEAMATMAQYKVQVISESPSTHGILYGNNLYQYHLNLGAKYSLLLNESARVGIRAFAGERFSPAVDFKAEDATKLVELKKTNDFEFGAGITFDMISTSKYVSGFACDYIHTCSPLLKNRWHIGSYWKILL